MSSIIHLVLLSGLLSVLPSCKVGPDYARPDIPVSDSFRMAEAPTDVQSLANVPWWDLYRDEELQRLIRIALDGNKDLKRAVASVDEFAARMLVAKTDFIPQMNATVNAPGFGNTRPHSLERSTPKTARPRPSADSTAPKTSSCGRWSTGASSIRREKSRITITTSTSPANTHRHDAYVVASPPISGPTATATATRAWSGARTG